jgi:hypothetical protein
MSGDDWQEGANKRRDERQTKVSDEPPTKGKRKDRKTWCRGKVGVEHIPECVLYRDFLPTWRMLICKTCGKQLKVYAPRREGQEKPSWVTF